MNSGRDGDKTMNFRWVVARLRVSMEERDGQVLRNCAKNGPASPITKCHLQLDPDFADALTVAPAARGQEGAG